MPLLPWMKKTSEDGKESLEVSLPEDMKAKLDKLDTLEPQLSKIDELVSGLKSIQAYVDADRAEKERARATAEAKARGESQNALGEELETLALTDPVGAMRRITEEASKPANAALLTLMADNKRREIFEDQKKFPYYTGDIKSEVDRLLAGQTLQLRNDPGVIENAYFSVVGRKSEDIREGKIKSRFASAESTRGTSSGNAGSGGEAEPPQITDDIRKLAKIFGTKPEEYAKMLQDEGVGYV